MENTSAPAAPAAVVRARATTARLAAITAAGKSLAPAQERQWEAAYGVIYQWIAAGRPAR